MAKSNRASIRRQEEKRITEQSRTMLLAGIARKFGTDVGNGERRLVLTSDDLLNIPAGETLHVKQGTPDDEQAASSSTAPTRSGGVTISVVSAPVPASVGIDPRAADLAEKGAEAIRAEPEDHSACASDCGPAIPDEVKDGSPAGPTHG